MLTKEERKAIAERANECVAVCGSLYEVLLGYPSACNTTYEEDMKKLLVRIVDLCDTSNMIELPVDKDGIPFKRGDTVYESDGTEHIVDGYAFSRANAKIVSVVDLINNTRILFETDELTHKRPVTIASLVERFKHVLEKGEMSYWAVCEICDIVDQLEKLGDSDD